MHKRKREREKDSIIHGAIDVTYISTSQARRVCRFHPSIRLPSEIINFMRRKDHRRKRRIFFVYFSLSLSLFFSHFETITHMYIYTKLCSKASRNSAMDASRNNNKNSSCKRIPYLTLFTSYNKSFVSK